MSTICSSTTVLCADGTTYDFVLEWDSLFRLGSSYQVQVQYTMSLAHFQKMKNENITDPVRTKYMMDLLLEHEIRLKHISRFIEKTQESNHARSWQSMSGRHKSNPLAIGLSTLLLGYMYICTHTKIQTIFNNVTIHNLYHYFALYLFIYKERVCVWERES